MRRVSWGKPLYKAFNEAFTGFFRRERLYDNWLLFPDDSGERWNPGGGITTANGPTVRWGTCPQRGSPYRHKPWIDPQNSR